MPNYQYECLSCNHSFEHFQSMLDKRLKKCPDCGKNQLTRLIGAGSAVIFKGNGFYETDYKKKEEPKPSSKAGECKACPAAKSCPSSE